MKAKQKMESKLHFGTVALGNFIWRDTFKLTAASWNKLYLMIGPWTISVKLIFLPD